MPRASGWGDDRYGGSKEGQDEIGRDTGDARKWHEVQRNRRFGLERGEFDLWEEF
jgi:hypothetical protein